MSATKIRTRVLITAGPTVEDIDPVRFISNRSSGKLGFALAAAASAADCDVVLVHGPVDEVVLRTAPRSAKIVAVRSAAEMYAAVVRHVAGVDIVIMNAAVADFTPVKTSATKLKKERGSVLLKFKPTVDILAELGRLKRRRPQLLLIGFALETGTGRTAAERKRSALASALEKIRSKNLDALVLNSPLTIGAERGDFVLLERDNKPVRLDGTKAALAEKLIGFALRACS